MLRRNFLSFLPIPLLTVKPAPAEDAPSIPATVTVASLEMGCPEIVGTFKSVFPRGCTVNQENIAALVAAGIRIADLLRCHVPITGHFTNNDGDQYWFKDGKQHRIGGPAILSANGDQYWFEDGKHHRAGGRPAVAFSNGDHYWYENGVFLKGRHVS